MAHSDMRGTPVQDGSHIAYAAVVKGRAEMRVGIVKSLSGDDAYVEWTGVSGDDDRTKALGRTTKVDLNLSRFIVLT